jgi:hypothetical protein
MRDVTRAELAGAELSGPFPEAGADLFRTDAGFEVLLREVDGFPVLELRGSDGGQVRAVEAEGGPRMGDEAVSVLLWERLENFDEVIERLAGPLPSP